MTENPDRARWKIRRASYRATKAMLECSALVNNAPTISVQDALQAREEGREEARQDWHEGTQARRAATQDLLGLIEREKTNPNYKLAHMDPQG